MYYSPDTHINVRPLDEWGGYLDVAGQEHFMFLDPLVAEGAVPAQTDRPIPDALRNHKAGNLQDGFDALEQSGDFWPNLNVTVITSLAEYGRDLGAPQEREALSQLVDESAVVFYGLTRSVRHVRARGLSTDRLGKLVTPQGPYQVEYKQQLNQALSPLPPQNRVCIDPPALGLQPPERALSTMRNMVEFAQSKYGDDWNEQVYPWLADLRHRDVWQSYGAGRIGAELYQRFYGADNLDNALVIVPLEQRGIALALHAAGVQNVQETHIGPTTQADEDMSDLEMEILQRRGISMAQLANL